MKNGQMIKDYGIVFDNDGVFSIITTPDIKYLFAGSSVGGRLKQISLESQEVVHDYGKIHDGTIACLETTRDTKWLIIDSNDKHVYRISVENREVEKSLARFVIISS
jgi:hypothetical protein